MQCVTHSLPPSPPPPPRFAKCQITPNPKMESGYFQSEFQFRISYFQSATLPYPPHLKMKSHFQSELQFKTADLQSVTLPTHSHPMKIKSGNFGQTSDQDFRFATCHITSNPKSFFSKSSDQDFRFAKCDFTKSLSSKNEKWSFLGRTLDQDFRFAKCHFIPPPPQ